MATYGEVRATLDGIIARANLQPEEVRLLHRYLAGHSGDLDKPTRDVLARMGLDPYSGDRAMLDKMGQAWRLLKMAPSDDAEVTKESNFDVWANEFVSGGQKYTTKNGTPPAEDESGGPGGIMGKYAELYKLLTAPVINPDGSTSDPIAKQLIATGQNVAERQAAARGIGGPLGATAAMTTAQSAIQPYLAQRQAQALQTLGQAAQYDLGLGQLDLQQLQMNNQVALQDWAAQKNQAQGVGAAVGTAVGAIPMLIPGGQAIAPFTMAAGGALGGGLGGLGSPQPTLSTSPRSTGGRWSSGRGGF